MAISVSFIMLAGYLTLRSSDTANHQRCCLCCSARGAVQHGHPQPHISSGMGREKPEPRGAASGMRGAQQLREGAGLWPSGRKCSWIRKSLMHATSAKSCPQPRFTQREVGESSSPADLRLQGAEHSSFPAISRKDSKIYTWKAAEKQRNEK